MEGRGVELTDQEFRLLHLLATHAGIVFSRDLGWDTQKKALQMTTYDPSPGWEPVRDTGTVIAR